MERMTRRRTDPFGLGALVASGTLAAHELGYLVGEAGSVSHAYLGLIGPLVLLAACVAAWCAAVRILRNDAGRMPSVGALTALQMAVYVVMEIGERIVSGSLDSLVSMPVLIGLGLQPLVAFVGTRLLAAGGRLVAALRPARLARLAHRLVDATLPIAVLVSNEQFVRLRVRGPPV